MSICPFASWRRVPGTEPAIVPRVVIFHTMVGTLPSVDEYFRSGRSGGIESTFGVGGPWEGAQYDGAVWQWRNTEEQADANYRANAFAVSIETSDGGDPNRKWSPKQVDSLVRLGRWLADEHGIPKRICPAWDASGFGWHVMFGAPGPWTPVAKVCPGPVRIKQLKEEVLPRIFAQGEEDMTPEEHAELFSLKQNLVDTLRQGLAGSVDRPIRAWAIQLEQAKANTDQIEAVLNTLPADITAAVVAALPSGSADAAMVKAVVEDVIARTGLMVNP